MPEIPVRVLAPLLLATCCTAQLQEIVDTYMDGSIRAKYSVDTEGRRSGEYVRYHRNGKIKLRGVYSKGRKRGSFSEYYRNGNKKRSCTYRDEVLHGELREHSKDGKRVMSTHFKAGVKDGVFSVTRNGKTLTRQSWSQGELTTLEGLQPFPRRRQAIRDALKKIRAEPKTILGVEADPKLPRRLATLRLLQAYRYLCGLRYADMELRQDWNILCDFGAELCRHIGRLDHTPKKPADMDADSYAKGYRGTSHSNLARGQIMERSVHGYMNDSDAKNIARVGHRRWCLNPAMKYTGFGDADRFSAMWSFDASGSGAKGQRAVYYPPSGYVPVGYFGDRHAWSVMQLRGGNPKKASARIEITELDHLYMKKGKPLALDYLGTTGNTLIFRPVGLDVTKGKRYWCEISLDGGKTTAHRYLVEFI